jgi:hypothetical protein
MFCVSLHWQRLCCSGLQINVFSFPALDLLFSFYSGDPANNGGVFVG